MTIKKAFKQGQLKKTRIRANYKTTHAQFFDLDSCSDGNCIIFEA